MGKEGLGIAQVGTPRGGIAHMPHGGLAGQALKIGFRKHVGHKPHALVFMHAARVARNDARAFLAAMLLGVQAEVGQTGRILVSVNAE